MSWIWNIGNKSLANIWTKLKIKELVGEQVAHMEEQEIEQRRLEVQRLQKEQV